MGEARERLRNTMGHREMAGWGPRKSCTERFVCPSDMHLLSSCDVPGPLVGVGSRCGGKQRDPERCPRVAHSSPRWAVVTVLSDGDAAVERERGPCPSPVLPEAQSVQMKEQRPWGKGPS